MPENGVIFSDGVEDDFLQFNPVEIITSLEDYCYSQVFLVEAYIL